MNGKQILTDKNHYMTELEMFSSLKVSRANTLYIENKANREFKGFGVAITGASCYNLSIMDSDARKELLTNIYTYDGLGLSVGRLTIGSSDYSAEVYSYDDEPFDVELKHFSVEREKKYIIPMIKEIPFHYYTGTIEETLKLKKAYPDIKLHFTEAGPRLYDNYDTDWCKWGIMISKAIKCGYSSFTGWNLMLNEMGGPNVGPFLCGGLVTRNTDDGELSYSGQYKTFSHIAKYINNNSDIYPINVGEEYDLHMSSYRKSNMDIEGFYIDNHDGKHIIVLINPNDEKRQTQFNLDGKWWYTELTPESISTIIIE